MHMKPFKLVNNQVNQPGIQLFGHIRLVFSLGIFLLTLQSIAEVIKNIATLKMSSSNN